MLGFHSRTEVQECGMPMVDSGRQNSPPGGNRVFCKTGTWSPEPGDTQFLTSDGREELREKLKYKQ